MSSSISSGIIRHINIPDADNSPYKQIDIATAQALTVGSKTFDGSNAVTITPADLGLSQALKFVGSTPDIMTDGQTNTPTNISTPSIGDVVLSNGNGEFVWLGSNWEELGSENSYLLKTGGEVTGDLTITSGATNFTSNATNNNFTTNVNFTGGPSKYFITNTTSNFTSNVNLTNESGYLNCKSKIILNSGVTYGTSNPGDAINNPVAGQVYFKLVT